MPKRRMFRCRLSSWRLSGRRSFRSAGTRRSGETSSIRRPMCDDEVAGVGAAAGTSQDEAQPKPDTDPVSPCWGSATESRARSASCTGAGDDMRRTRTRGAGAAMTGPRLASQRKGFPEVLDTLRNVTLIGMPNHEDTRPTIEDFPNSVSLMRLLPAQSYHHDHDRHPKVVYRVHGACCYCLEGDVKLFVAERGLVPQQQPRFTRTSSTGRPS